MSIVAHGSFCCRPAPVRYTPIRTGSGVTIMTPDRNGITDEREADCDMPIPPELRLRGHDACGCGNLTLITHPNGEQSWVHDWQQNGKDYRLTVLRSALHNWHRCDCGTVVGFDAQGAYVFIPPPPSEVAAMKHALPQLFVEVAASDSHECAHLRRALEWMAVNRARNMGCPLEAAISWTPCSEDGKCKYGYGGYRDCWIETALVATEEDEDDEA